MNTPKKQHKAEMMIPVGEKRRFYCPDCTTEFVILHEPDYQDPQMRESFQGESNQVEWCPFCGLENVEAQ